MDQKKLESRLAGLNLSDVRYFPSIGSTNDEAARWAANGAGDWSLVVADEQTAGRGREGRNWITPPESGLAFSLVLRPGERERGEEVLPRLTALGALAVADGLERQFGLPARIKWPNDVLILGRKVAGVLCEAQWSGDRLQALVLGIGINVATGSVSQAVRRESHLRFPATSIEEALGKPVDRLELLYIVLKKLNEWRMRLSSPDFIRAWEERLAFQGEWVQIYLKESQEETGLGPQEGQIVGLASDGCLCLRTRSGVVITVRAGEVRLLPVNMEVGDV